VTDRPSPCPPPEGRPPFSIDALVFALLCAAYLPMRFIIPTPPVIPGSAPATVLLTAGVMGYFALDLIEARSDRARRRVLLAKWILVAIAIGVITLAPLVMNILVRQQSAPYLHAYDGLIQTEAAVDLLPAHAHRRDEVDAEQKRKARVFRSGLSLNQIKADITSA